jgi:Ca-activated chloride channel family protein
MVTYSSGWNLQGGRLRSSTALLWALLLWGLAPPVAGAQSTSNDAHLMPSAFRTEDSIDSSLKTNGKSFKVEVNVVLVPVTITDPTNRIVTGLDKENFQVFEGRNQQGIRYFSCEDAPISLGVIFDMSGSMANKIDKSREAVVEFFKTANPQDEFFVIAFSEEPKLLQDFTSSIGDIEAKLVTMTPKGRTALLDAVYWGVSKIKNARNQRMALLIISDGGDNHSRHTETEIKSLVKEADVQIYTIGLYDLSPTTVEERTGPLLLSELAEITGGRSFTVSDPSELEDVATKIGIELRNQYVLGYIPKNPAHDGNWRKIKVRLLPPRGLPTLHVYAKTGYYAPSQ